MCCVVVVERINDTRHVLPGLDVANSGAVHLRLHFYSSKYPTTISQIGIIAQGDIDR